MSLHQQSIWRSMMKRSFWRFIYSYAKSLNRRAEVEEQLHKFARGARGPITPAEAKDMANKLGNPNYTTGAGK